MALWKTLTNAAAAANEAFGTPAPSAKASKGTTDSTGKRPPTQDEEPLPPKQALWVARCTGNLMQSSLEAFGGEVEERFQQVENKITDTEAKLLARVNQLEGIVHQNKKEMENQLIKAKAAFDSLEEEFKHVKEQASSAPLSPAGSSIKSAASSVPYEQRTQATLGCLGWDTPADQLVQRGEQVLGDCGYKKPDHYTAISCPRRDGGSLCHVHFSSATVLQEAKLKVRTLSKVYHQERQVWLDASKSREELAPNRYLHRMATHLELLQNMKQDPEPVIKNVPTKTMTIGGVLIGYASSAGWTWGAKSIDKIALQDQPQALAYATSS